MNGKGIKIDPSRIKAILELETPKSKKDLESFLGMINYCSRCLENVTVDTSYLYGLIKKRAEVNWRVTSEDQRHVEAIQAVKDKIGRTNTLAIPSEYGRFILTTNASDLGVGAILSQIQYGKERIISYFSKAHSKAENNYSTTEKELMAVIKATDHYRHYLLGRNFLLKMDHSAFKYLFKSTNMKAKFARWALYLQEYDMDIEHVKGQDNPSDCLSRLGMKKTYLRKIQVDDTEIELMKDIHDKLAHGSPRAMEYHLRSRGITNLSRKVLGVVRKCLPCQRSRVHYKPRSVIAVSAKKTNEIWEIDLVGPLPRSR